MLVKRLFIFKFISKGLGILIFNLILLYFLVWEAVFVKKLNLFGQIEKIKSFLLRVKLFQSENSKQNLIRVLYFTICALIIGVLIYEVESLYGFVSLIGLFGYIIIGLLLSNNPSKVLVYFSKS
jgi:hypothetical protein